MGFFSKLWKKVSSTSDKTKADKKQQRPHDHHHHRSHNHHHQPRGSHSPAPDARGRDLFQGYMDGSASNDATQFQASLAALNVSEERRAQSGRSGRGVLPPEIPTYWRLEDSPSATSWPLPADFSAPPPPQLRQRPGDQEYQPLSRSARNYHKATPTPTPTSASTKRHANYYHSGQDFPSAQSESSIPITRPSAVRQNRPPPISTSRQVHHEGHSSSSTSTSPSRASAARHERRLQRQANSEAIRKNARHWLTSETPAGRPTGIGAAPGVPAGFDEPVSSPEPVMGRIKGPWPVERKTPRQVQREKEFDKWLAEFDVSKLPVYSEEHVRKLNSRGIFPPPPPSPPPKFSSSFR